MKKENKIDNKIKNLVETLKTVGIPTSGSCQGHVGYGHPAPWIKITPKNKSEDLKLTKKMSALLLGFYKGRQVSSDVRISIKKANSGFWLHNGGQDYENSWKEMMKRVKAREAGKIAPNAILSEKDKIKRRKNLPFYQREMEEFARYIINEQT